MSLRTRHDPKVGDLVMTNMSQGNNCWGIVVEVVNKFYWLDYKIILSNGRITTLGRSSILSCEECSN